MYPFLFIFSSYFFASLLQPFCLLQCSASCFKIRGVHCKVGEEYYKEHFCNQQTKPKDKTECELKECVQWSTGDWSACSATCGNGVQTREVFCESTQDKRVMDLNYCSELAKPDATKICQTGKCPVSFVLNYFGGVPQGSSRGFLYFGTDV